MGQFRPFKLMQTNCGYPAIKPFILCVVFIMNNLNSKINMYFLIIKKTKGELLNIKQNKNLTSIPVVRVVVVFSPGLLTGGESVSARAFITVALPRPVAGA